MKTKICRDCGKEKPIEEFTKHRRMNGGYDTRCKECNTKAFHNWKKNNREKFLNYQNKYNKERAENKRDDARKRREIIKTFISEYKSNKCCLKCGYNKNSNILVFHHRDPEKKEFKIAQRNTSSPEIILEEMKKCDLLCPNCHRELHWKEHQENLKENVSETTLKKRKYRKWFNELKKDGCSLCGEKRFHVLDFHHLNDKEYEIHKMVQKRMKKSKVLEEISKCILLCANCHAELHL
jgi:hypothetical protein